MCDRHLFQVSRGHVVAGCVLYMQSHSRFRKAIKHFDLQQQSCKNIKKNRFKQLIHLLIAYLPLILITARIDLVDLLIVREQSWRLGQIRRLITLRSIGVMCQRHHQSTLLLLLTQLTPPQFLKGLPFMNFLFDSQENFFLRKKKKNPFYNLDFLLLVLFELIERQELCIC
jgi:hypothetical protein